MSQSSPSSAGTKTPLLNNSTYNVLKHVAAIVLPALATLYFTVAHIWHFADVDQVMATITAVNTALGVLLGYSTSTYNSSDSKYDGIIKVVDTGEKIVADMVLNGDAQNILTMPSANFKVDSVDSTTAHGASFPKE